MIKFPQVSVKTQVETYDDHKKKVTICFSIPKPINMGGLSLIWHYSAESVLFRPHSDVIRMVELEQLH